MDCDECREVVSARLDGEAGAAEAAAAGVHVARCPACREHAARVTRLTMGVRSAVVLHAVPDAVGSGVARSPRLPAAARASTPPPATLAPVVATLTPAARCGCDSGCACGCRQGRACRCAHGVA